MLNRPMPQGNETLQGTLERITYHNPDNGFCVLRVKVSGHRELVTVTGNNVTLNVGEYIHASGRWENHRQHGLQFHAQQLHSIPPNTLEGIETYLGSGLIKGIGSHYAKRLVQTFGLDVLTIIETEPERLRELTGIGKKRVQTICQSWAAQKAIRDIMLFLQTHGVGTARAVRIYKTYGDAAIAILKENPYRLAHDIPGIGFKTADELAKRLGLGEHSLVRACAGTHHVLHTLSTQGHCAIPLDSFKQHCGDLLQIPSDIIQQAIEYEVNREQLIIEEIDHTFCIYTMALYRAEKGVVSQLVKLIQGKTPWPTIDVARALPWVETQTGMTLSATQQDAVKKALSSKVLILTGGPGVGKTTVIKSILRILEQHQVNIALCAPTGRAAKRLAETTGSDAKTIHRLLEYDPKQQQFRYNPAHPLAMDLLVVDEASMMDVLLMHQLLRAIPSRAALLIVGDVDQLPSVGPGNVLQDMIASEVIPTVRLHEIFRQAADSHIIVNAHRINQGLLPVLPDAKIPSDFYFIEANTPEEIQQKLLYLVRTKIPHVLGVDRVNDIQVLSPMQRGSLGVRALNHDLQQALNPLLNESITRYGTTFARGDNVIQLVNNYDKDVFNGDVGRITRIDQEDTTLTISFDGREVSYEFDELDELALAYAITIHKSQGSEYPAVVIPLTTQHYRMLARNLLYTGVTRGKKFVILVGQKKALAMAVKNSQQQTRITNLRQTLSITLHSLYKLSET